MRFSNKKAHLLALTRIIMRTIVGDMDLQYMANKLRDLRESAGLNQEQLEEKSGVSRRTIQQIEDARGNPTLKVLSALANTLDASIVDFFEEKPGVPIKDFSEMLNEHLRRLEEEAKKVSSPIPPKIWAAWTRAPQKARQLCEIFLTPPSEEKKALELLENLHLPLRDVKTVYQLLLHLHGPPKPPSKA